MRTGEASGFEIAILIFAVALLAVPASSYILQALGSSPDAEPLIRQGLPFVFAGLAIFGFPKLRALALVELSKTIPIERRAEVIGVALAKVLVLVGAVGSFVLWAWVLGGPDAVVSALKSDPAEVARAKAFSIPGLLHALVLAPIVAPIVEELVFRGLLYRAWEKRWGAFTAAILSSALFAIYHPHFHAAFAAAIIFVCLVRRTGTLWSSILVHGFSNLVLWYPILGPVLFPRADNPSGELSAWSLHLACLAFAAIALPFYIWLAVRKPYVVSA